MSTRFLLNQNRENLLVFIVCIIYLFRNSSLQPRSENMRYVLVKSRQTHHTHTSALRSKDTKRFLQIGTRDLRYNKFFRSKNLVTWYKIRQNNYHPLTNDDIMRWRMC